MSWRCLHDPGSEAVCVCQVRAEVAPSPTLAWKLLGRQVEGWRPGDEGAGPWVAGSSCDFRVGCGFSELAGRGGPVGTGCP